MHSFAVSKVNRHQRLVFGDLAVITKYIHRRRGWGKFVGLTSKAQDILIKSAYTAQ